MKHIRTIALAAALVCIVCAHADRFSFSPSIKFRIAPTMTPNGALAIGSNHSINSPACLSTSSTYDDDCYWYILEYKTGKYAIRNAKTSQYLVWDEVRSESPIRRYMHLDTSVKSDSALWTIGQTADGAYYFRNVAGESYCFDVRTNSYVLGTYSNSSTPTSSNELFYIYKEDGTEYTEATDSNTVCGVDASGYYWSTAELTQPVVYTTDDSDPVLYAITNVRSGLYVIDGTALTQTSEEPDRLFYFKEAEGGVQIMIQGGGYVSGKLPTTYTTSATDVTVSSGTPSTDDHVWSIAYSADEEYPGYSVGVATCSENTSYNWHSRNSYIYWNDFQEVGICYYSVDGGSTFAFKSKDVRHRNYLLEQGIVIPSDTELPVDPTDPDPTDPTDPTDPDSTYELADYTGPVTHVFRADGKIDAIPNEYIESTVQTADSITITTKDSGPTYTYAAYEVDSVSTSLPASLPKFNSFKFNNKFNPHLIEDAAGVFYGDSLITVNPLCIGKRLRPSFKIDDDAQVYIGTTLQKSKVTRTRYDKDVVYTIARRGHTILRRTTEGKYVTCPYGRQTTVRVTFATDQATGTYKVPTIYLTTDDGTSITSKTTYKTGTITIDGGGAFPDMAQTAMQIKGRGNTSWNISNKKPYHMKFDTSVKPLGLTKGKHWNLIANAQSKSMTTNAVAMKIAQLVETAAYNHEIPVELYINGEYRGSYNLTEKIGFSNNSIDLADETSAVMLELDSYWDDDFKFKTTSFTLPVNIKEPDLSEGTTALTYDQIQEHFNEAITAQYNDEEMANHFDIDYLARYLFVYDLAMNTEFMHPKSTFCYNEDITNSDSKYIFGPVWDFDWGYGYEFTSNYFTYSASTDYWNSVSMEADDWVRDLRYSGESVNKAYYNLWHNFMSDGRLDELVEFCQDYYDFASASFTHDNTKWSSGNASTYATVTDRAKTWLKERANYIYNYLGTTLGYSSKGYLDTATDTTVKGDVNGDGAVTIADVVCTLNYMLNLPNEDFDFVQADQDANDIVTIKDVLTIRDLTTGSTASGRFYGLPQAEASLMPGKATSRAGGVDIALDVYADNGSAYSGLQFDLAIPQGMAVADLDISSSIPEFELYMTQIGSTASERDLYRVSIYSSGNHTLPAGHTALTLSLDWGECQSTAEELTVSVSNVLFANSVGEDERAASRSTKFSNTAMTGISNTAWVVSQNGNKLTLGATEDTDMPIYSTDGKLFGVYKACKGGCTITLPQGVYIVNKKKIAVK
jgi:hypothetical protein